MNKELYKNKVKDFCNLMNVNDLSNRPTAMAIFDKINDRFTDDDMVRSFDEMMEAEVIKLTYPILMRYLRKYKELRIGAELQRRKLREKNEVKEVMMTHAEIAELVDAVINKKPTSIQVPDFIQSNATIWTRDGRALSAYIDPNDPNLEPGKAIGIVYEQHGDQMVRAMHIMLGMVKHRILTKRQAGPPGHGGSQLMFGPPPDPDFPHEPEELELPHDAYQGTLGMDRPTDGDAR